MTTEVWISSKAKIQILNLVQDFYPKEVGGLLWGYQIPKQKCNVITDIVGPGPNAQHSIANFIPDYGYQEYKIAKLYEKDRRFSYIGDWHSHPDGLSFLSRKDKKTLRRISRYRPARLGCPLMLVVAGSPSNWTITAYQLVQIISVFVFKRRRIIKLQTKFYDNR